ncbi:response regulator [Algoriphagus mannitolivorans]|uniref:response regulator n=1 Tax=Algoriphagus mannitolivorans TaxID=226504 RepID=UPI0004178CAB|nr:response regulator [Algoriphagus mannitolivorans]
MEENLIVIDDDEIALKILQRMINIINPSISLMTFVSGLEAIRHLKSKKHKKPPFILVDFHLKDVNEWEILEELESLPEYHSKVFIISSSVNSELPFQSRRFKSVAGFIQKPITFETLKSINQKISEN